MASPTTTASSVVVGNSDRRQYYAAPRVDDEHDDDSAPLRPPATTTPATAAAAATTTSSPVAMHTATVASTPRPTHSEHKRVMGIISITAMTWFYVSGGPIGSEEIISAGGPLIGIIGLLVFPWLWSVPVSLVTAELACAYPCDGGGLVWVKAAFGHFWGFQEGFWSWVSGVVDNALYPVLALDLLQLVLPAIDTGWAYVAKVAFVLLLTIPNMLGLEIVTTALTIMTGAVLAVFCLLVAFQIPNADISHWIEARPASEIRWAALIRTLYWNYTGFNVIGTVAGEVKEPSRTIPRGIALTVAVVATTYIVPLSMASAVNAPPWQTWTDGSFSEIARDSAGPAMGWLVTATSLVSSIGLFTTEMMVDAYALVGMAEAGLAPQIFTWRHPRFNSPWPALLLSVIIIAVLVEFDFAVILAVDNFINCVALLTMLLAALKLRFYNPDVPRPYRVPCGKVAFALVLVPPLLVSAGIFYSVFIESLVSTAISIIVILVGGLAYLAMFHPRCARLRRAALTAQGAAAASPCGRCVQRATSRPAASGGAGSGGQGGGSTGRRKRHASGHIELVDR